MEVGKSNIFKVLDGTTQFIMRFAPKTGQLDLV